MSTKQDLNIILTDPVETLDPLKILYGSDWKVASNIFEGLVSLDANNIVLNELVDSIEITKDKLQYKFYLKKNIYFHDNPCFPNGKGRRLSSHDVKYSFERLANSRNNFFNWELISGKIKGINKFHRNQCDSISGIKIINSLIFQIDLIHLYSPFLKILTSPNFYIIPREAIEYYSTRIDENPVGTGPFRVSEYMKYEKIVLVKNDSYHQFDNFQNRLPYLNTITYRTIKETENRFGELIKGNTHIINANKNEYTKFKNDSLLKKEYSIRKINKGLGVRFWGFYFNNGIDTERYKNLRKHIAYKFDRSFINEKYSLNIKANSLVPEHLVGDYKFQRSERNLEQNSPLIMNDSIEIMANLEYRDLIELEKTFTNTDIKYKRIIKPDGYYSEIHKIKPTLFRVSMLPAFPDPIEYYSLFYSKNSGGVNLGNFSNKKYDEIFEYLQKEENVKLKKVAIAKLEEILKEEVAAIYLTHQGPIYFLYSKKLKQLNFKYILPDFQSSFFEL
jgi:peptide/nickel transport system substrate-binding protein